MGRSFIYSCLILIASLVSGLSFAQDKKNVEVQVWNKTDEVPIIGARVMAFNTVALAQDAMDAINKSRETGEFVQLGDVVDKRSMEGGYCTIGVMETGAIVIYPEDLLVEPKMVKVNYKDQFRVEFSVVRQLDAAVAVAAAEELKADSEMDIVGNTLTIDYDFVLPPHYGKSNARLIIQPYLLEANKKDTAMYRRPIVCDGAEYHMTQYRRMGYDNSVDPLFQFVVDTLSPNGQKFTQRDSIHLEDPTKLYYINYEVLLEDYNVIYYHDNVWLKNTGRIRRPLKFLEYKTKSYSLDPVEYKKEPRVENIADTVKLSLKFLVNQAELDPKDQEGRRLLNETKRRLVEISTGADSRLTELYIEGVSSPDGPYAKNKVLAKKRTDYVANTVYGALSRSVKDRMLYGTKSEVAPWSAIVDSLMRDSLISYAEQVQKKIDAAPNNPDAQWRGIITLPFYKAKISKYLNNMRTVSFRYQRQERRSLKPDEILKRYRYDEDYRSGEKEFHLYEFWHLFYLVKDEKELEELYKRAIKQSNKLDRRNPWELPANNLAELYISQDRVDTTLLKPFIDITIHHCNQPMRSLDGITRIINKEEIVANQLVMYLKANNFRKASIMAKLLPDNEKYREIKAFTLCLGGYYRGGNTPEERQARQKTFEIVSETTPLNKVVMYLARKIKYYDLEAEKAVEALDPNDPLTYYLKAVIICRKYSSYYMIEGADYDLVSEHLADCFIKDPKYVQIAESDDDLYEEAIKAAHKLVEEYNQNGFFTRMSEMLFY